MTDILPSTEPITNSVDSVQNITPPIDAIPTPTVLNETPKKRNYLFWILGILALAAISATSFLILISKSKLTTATSDMSSWKTYINFDYGYSLKYPNNISIREPKESDFIFFELPTEKENRNITPALWITYLTNNLSLNPKDFYVRLTKGIEAEHVSNNLPPVISPVETKETKINGFDAFQYIAFAGDGNMLHTYLKSGKVIVDISYYSDLDNPNFPNNKKDKYIFDQILSTFKFIDTQSKLPEVPVYPQAKFIKKEFIPPCPGEQATCDVDSYTWESPGNINEVISWYEQDQSKSGWKLSGGAGLEGTNRYGSFSNGKVKYWLTIYLLGPKGPVGIELRGPLNYQ